jgi:hypothetical protein
MGFRSRAQPEPKALEILPVGSHSDDFLNALNDRLAIFLG